MHEHIHRPDALWDLIGGNQPRKDKVPLKTLGLNPSGQGIPKDPVSDEQEANFGILSNDLLGGSQQVLMALEME
jgi:hypothetical protein